MWVKIPDLAQAPPQLCSCCSCAQRTSSTWAASYSCCAPRLSRKLKATSIASLGTHKRIVSTAAGGQIINSGSTSAMKLVRLTALGRALKTKMELSWSIRWILWESTGTSPLKKKWNEKNIGENTEKLANQSALLIFETEGGTYSRGTLPNPVSVQHQCLSRSFPWIHKLLLVKIIF